MARAIDRDGAIKKADTRLIGAMPRVAKYLSDHEDSIDRVQLEFYSKLLPGALERHFSVADSTQVTDPSVVSAIQSLTTSFASRSVRTVDSDTTNSNSNAELSPEETVADANEAEESEDSVLSPTNNLLISAPHELVSESGSNGLTNKDAPGMANARVQSRSRLQGKGSYATGRASRSPDRRQPGPTCGV